jgi:hypothetical protein
VGLKRRVHQTLVDTKTPWIVRCDAAVAHARVGAVGLHSPRLTNITERCVEDCPERASMNVVLDRSGRFNARLEVSIHPIRAPDEEVPLRGILLTGAEVEDAAVFEESPDDGADSNRL